MANNMTMSKFVLRTYRYLGIKSTRLFEVGEDMALDNDYEKLNIENTDSIDGLAFEQETSSLILLLADGMDWIDMNRHLLLLQDKLNTYIWYIDSRQYEEKYIWALGKRGDEK